MNGESLLASAGINLGLALVVLCLFSILKRRPSNACIYYARPLSVHVDVVNRIIKENRNKLCCGICGSVSWIGQCMRVTEDEILDMAGLDALVLIRLFKFGIKFFVVSAVVGMVILVPVNYFAYDGSTTEGSHSMDAFTISNIEEGSDRLWVHFSCLWLISCYGLYLLYKEYDDLLTKRIQYLQKNKGNPEQFTLLVREIPVCEEHGAYSCSVEHFFSKHYQYDYQSYQILYSRKDLDKLLNEAKCLAREIENLKSTSLAKGDEKEHLLAGAIYRSEKESLYRNRLEEICHCIRLIQCQKGLKEKELPVAFVTFRTRRAASLAAQSQQHSNPLLWITEMAPEPRDVLWRNLELPFRRMPLYKIGVYCAATLLTIFFAIPVTAVQGIAKFERLKTWFPPAMAIQLIPGLAAIVTGYVPSAVLSGFIYLIPFAMYAMARLAGYVSRSKNEIKASNMFFYFLLGNVFFLSLLSGSLLDQIGNWFAHPGEFPSRLATAVSAQADFFITYILTNGLAGFSLEILQPGLLILDMTKSLTWGRGKEKTPYLYSLPYCRFIPLVSISFLIGMVYAVVAPLILPFLVCYFLLGYIVFVNQIKDVYEIVYETCGQYWPFINHYIFLSIVLSQVTMIGLFGLKSKPSASIATIPLLLLTMMFNEYCKYRFLPTFFNYSIQDAMKNDELAKDNGSMTEPHDRPHAIEAYHPPSLRSTLEFAAAEGSTSNGP